MLDIQVWVENGEDGKQRLLHEYYEKPVTSDLVVMAQFALPTRTKMTVLSQEIIRMMRNTAKGEKVEEKAKILTGLMKKMAKSGYAEKERKDVLRSGLDGVCIRN